MHRVITVDLVGRAQPFRVHEDAYEALRVYLDQARARLGADPDAAEVIEDLERSIGERLAERSGAEDRIVTKGDVVAVLEQVGTVDPAGTSPTGMAASPAATTSGRRTRRRRLYRIREGQDIAGVCTGLAVYADLDVGWVRTIFVLGALVTAGLVGVVYVALMFLLPVLPTREAWIAEMEALEAQAL
jgi:phage shock protein PspC (stress-responsive transcriptional regulator)